MIKERFNHRVLVGAVLLVVALIACGGSDVISPTVIPTVDETLSDIDSDTVSLRFGDEVNYTVTVEDEGDNEQNPIVTAAVTYMDKDGFIREDVVRLPWRIQFDVMGADRLHIEAELLDGPATRIGCTIGTRSVTIVESRVRNGETICDVDRR